MEQTTMKHIITVILRLVGVLTIFIGLIMTTQMIIRLVATNSVMSGFIGISVNGKRTAGHIANWTIAGHVSIVAWGFILMAYAKGIAKSITKE